ncbi:hypothetical protein LAD54_10370 [Klebsiella pneumoniae]|uniref:hypothetical protein n=1 Tax=Klebsiella pneumoniae TaxID=573 RepID=UPI00226FABAA|nr:hypothetical protein [Klebsiella pneumoniae]MCX9939053.1 hypothetical protein [Klebsiella pneumoniae]MCY0259827.1 hypothetical protein [Klebsiella pneumoniae]
MALTKCKECKKEVSASAKTCPHCGIDNPGVKMMKGCLIVILLSVGFGVYMTFGSDDKAASTSQTCTNTDTQCIFDKNLADAITKCKPLVERAAKFDYEWTDGMLDPMFSRGRIDAKKNEFTFIGDKVKFTNGFNAKTNMTYACTLNLKTKEATDFSIEQGKL